MHRPHTPARDPGAVRSRVLRPTVMMVAWLWSGCSGTQQPAANARTSDPAEAEVLAAAQAVLSAINDADASGLRSVMRPDARVVAVRPGQPPSRSTVEEMAPLISDPTRRFVERMWDPTVRVQGPIASVWAPYDFYRDGSFSHCGVDAFLLVRVDGDWQVESLVYNTLQPPACEPHPDGPPAG